MHIVKSYAHSLVLVSCLHIASRVLERKGCDVSDRVHVRDARPHVGVDLDSPGCFLDALKRGHVCARADADDDDVGVDLCARGQDDLGGFAGSVADDLFEVLLAVASSTSTDQRKTKRRRGMVESRGCTSAHVSVFSLASPPFET